MPTYDPKPPPLYASNLSPLLRGFQPVPLAFDFMAQIETSAFPMAKTVPKPRRYVKGDEVPVSNQYTYPTADVERIRWFDTGSTCLSVEPDAITTTGRAYELARTNLNGFGAGVLEGLATFWDIEALDENGLALFEYSTWPADADPCPLPLMHPTPDVDPLRLRFVVVAQEIPAFATWSSRFPTAVNVLPQTIGGFPVVPSWSDARYGAGTIYSTTAQFLVSGRVLLRMFVVVRGPQRFRIRKIGGRLQGWWHAGGPRGAAIRSTTERIQ